MYTSETEAKYYGCPGLSKVSLKDLFSLLISRSIWQEKRHKPRHFTIKFKFKKPMSIYLERDEINCSVLIVFLVDLLLTQLCHLLILSQMLKATAFFKGIKVLKDCWNNGVLSFK